MQFFTPLTIWVLRLPGVKCEIVCLERDLLLLLTLESQILHVILALPSPLWHESTLFTEFSNQEEEKPDCKRRQWARFGMLPHKYKLLFHLHQKVIARDENKLAKTYLYPVRMSKSEDLPAPDGPMMATREPGW
jgi:hypothetical protein